MTLDERRWRWTLLVDAVTALCQEPEEQIASLGDAHPDELGLDYDNGYSVVSTLLNEGVDFSAEALSLLARLDAALTKMSGPENTALWTPEGLRTRPEWARIRTLARETLGSLPAAL